MSSQDKARQGTVIVTVMAKARQGHSQGQGKATVKARSSQVKTRQGTVLVTVTAMGKLSQGKVRQVII